MAKFNEITARADAAEEENADLTDQINSLNQTVNNLRTNLKKQSGLQPSNFPSGGQLKRRRGKPLKPPKITRHETRYTSRINPIIESVQENIREELFDLLDGIVVEHASDTQVVPVMFLDDANDRISRIFGQIKVFAEALLPDARLRNAAERTANEVNQANKDFNEKNVRIVLGVDVFAMEPWLVPEQEAFTKENISLIKGVSTEEISDIEQLVFRMVRSGESAPAIREAIRDVMETSKNRAQLIARDQVSKFNGRLSEQRQTQMGVKVYTWRDSSDGKVRDTHRALDGTTQKWSSPPVTVVSGKRAGERNHPGEDILCRCIAEPIFPDVRA